MADRLARFKREIRESDAEVADRTAVIIANYRQILTRLADEFRRALDNEDEERAAAILATIRGGAWLEEMRDELDAGLAIFALELEGIKGRFVITEEDILSAQTIAESEINKVEEDILTTAASLASTLGIVLATRGRVGSAGDIVTQAEGGLEGRTKANLTTGAAAYRSGMEISKAESVDESPVWEYVGPDDEKTRDFCHDVLNRQQFWTRDEIEELDNHPEAQLLPVFIYGGGYNCRHRWIYTRRT